MKIVSDMALEEKVRLKLKSYGINLEDEENLLSKEYANIEKTNNSDIILCFEHLLLSFIVDIERIKQKSIDDYIRYLKKIKKKDISFWGERFEIQWHSALLWKFVNPATNIRRGEDGKEADFIFDYCEEVVSMEITSLTNNISSEEIRDPIKKINACIRKKENKPYVSMSCCLVIDISNLVFYRFILNNFPITIHEYYTSLTSTFGAVLLIESSHIMDDNNPKYVTRAYNWINPNATVGLQKFIKDNLKYDESDNNRQIRFKVN